MAQWIAIAAAAAILGSVVDAIPTIAFPINSQVPPVARISDPFSYTFSDSTFSSDLPLSYDLSNAPTWLSLDSSTRTLSGTPMPSDVGTGAVTGINISLTASDKTGSVTLNATLVISTNPAPVINMPLSAQLASFGASSWPSTLLYHPSTNFEFKFEPETFTEKGGTLGLNYYSVTLDNTPLPSWIHFDGSTLSYTGRTPDYQSLIQPPQTFGVQLIASDVQGFAGISIPFEFEVGVHLLCFKTTEMVINATVGHDINFDGLSNNLELDGAPVNRSSITSVAVQTPSWMAFNNNTFVLSGTVPADALSTNITVRVTDIYGDIENAVVFVDVATAIFNSPIKNLNVSAGSSFSFNFSSYLRNTSDVEIAAQFSPMTSWIKFDSQTFIMSGEAPSSAPASKISVTLVATSKSSQSSSSQSFALLVTPGDHPLSLSAPSTSSTSHHPASTTAHVPLSNTTTPSSISSHKGLSNGVIAAIVVPISLLLLSGILALCCYRQRRRAAKRRSKSPPKSEISAPMEVESSLVEIIGPPRLPPPAPLQLDTSGFTTEHSSSTYTNEQKGKSRNLADNPLRRSQTMSAVSGLLSAEFRQSDSMRARAYSDNALTRTDKSWRTTQDSAYPTISSSSRTNSSNRLTRNYSRKGQDRRSGRIRSRNSALRDSALSMQRPQSTILNLGDSNFSFTPVDNYSALSKRTSILGTSEFAYVGNRLQYTRSARRKSRFIQGVDQRTVFDNEGRDSTVSTAGSAEKRRSVGQGQDWELAHRPSDSRHGLTVNSAATGRELDSLSNVSAITENTDVLEDQVAPLNIRTIPLSRIPPSSARLSDSSTSTRPVSRRVVGSSPFFAGNSSMRSSRASRNKARTSYADSPTVPEEPMIGDLDDVVRGGLREETMTPRDSFGISYGAAREGTRQLKSYLQSRLARKKTNGSLKSNDSKESRIESADSQPNIVVHARTPEFTQSKPEEEDEYEDYLPDDYSEGSWETHCTPPRDSLGNIIGYGLGESSQIAISVAQRHLAPSTALRSHPTSPLPPDIGPNARMVSGRGKRPLSVDAGANKGSVRALVEDDYTAFL